ncbi:unnamed protein product, partial [marine sediment metagenome]
RHARVDLRKYGNRKVRLEFITSGSGNAVIHAFWGNPSIYDLRRRKDKDYNIIYIIEDSTNTTMLGCYGSRLGLSPNIDKFAGDALIFKNYFTTANWTRPAIMSLFTSRYPSGLYSPAGFSVSGDAAKRFCQRKIKSLPWRLEEKGYTCAAISNNIFLIEPSRIGLDIGFNEINDYSRHHYSTVDITAGAIEWLCRNRHKKFFLYIHYDNTHLNDRPLLKWVWKVLKDGDSDKRAYYMKYKAQ